MDRLLSTFNSVSALARDKLPFELPSIETLLRLGSYAKLGDMDSFKDTFSPARIFVQIVILQCVYYITAIVMFMLLAFLGGYLFSFDWVFSWEPITLENALGLTLTICWLVDSLFCIGFMTIIVGRSKLAWDFAITIHAINFIVVWVYSGKFPKAILWWILQVVSSVMLVSLGTWTSRWRELRDTFFEGMNDVELGQADPENVPMSSK